MTTETLIILAPELLLSLAAVIIYTLALWVKEDRLWRWLGLAAVAGAFFLWGIGPQHVSHLAQREVISDPLGDYFRAILLVASFLLILCQWEPLPARGTPEVVATVLLAVTGAMLATAAKDLILVFVGLELLSLATYVLLYVGRQDRLGREATFKYFFLSVLSSAILVYGLSFLYGLGGSTDFATIAAGLRKIAGDDNLMGVVASLALILVAAGLAFKAAAAPFHFYAPEVYTGTSYPNAALLSVVPKVAGLVVLLRITGTVMPSTLTSPWQLLAVLAALSLLVGNLGALLQEDLRRLLAYSSIAHAGYMLLAVAAYLAGGRGQGAFPFFAFDGAAAFALYLLVYLLATVGVFAGILALRRSGEEIRTVSDLAGAAWSSLPPVRVTAWCMVICLFSLAGVPPLAGFWGKLAVFGSALSIPPAEAEAFGVFVALAIFAAINTAVGAAYYLRVVGSLVFSPQANGLSPRAAPGPTVAAMMTAILIVGIGLWWQPWWRWAQSASPRVGTRIVAERVESSTPNPLASRPTECRDELPLPEANALVPVERNLESLSRT
ncbi:MAG: NADH-quinone oxidoreductase subunit N [Thermoguttaceae bacterium]|nr:NADH-quinone oxidoreductase subunit N [Thermoguttaceae bacterium]MDW8079612.1 NADH-quinone oxidoreductase subunit N [Thermoguttaceae bacterium]